MTRLNVSFFLLSSTLFNIMNNGFCLGFSGQKNSGKDESYLFIKPFLDKEFNTNFKKISFADPVKNILCLFSYIENNESVPVTREMIEEFKNKKDIPNGWNMDVRDALVNIGNRLREIYPNIWIDLALKNNSCVDKIITDIRYPNEIKELKNNPKTIIVRIIRNEVYKKDGNESEISLNIYDKKILSSFEGECDDGIPYDYVLKNNGNLDELMYKIQYELLPFITRKWKYFI